MPQTRGPSKLVRTVSPGEAPSKGGAGHPGVVSAARRPPHSAQHLKRTAAPYEQRDGNRRLASAAEVRGLSEVFRTPPVRGTSAGSSVIRSPDRPLECPAG